MFFEDLGTGSSIGFWFTWAAGYNLHTNLLPTFLMTQVPTCSTSPATMELGVLFAAPQCLGNPWI